jgi:hypothetical protein
VPLAGYEVGYFIAGCAEKAYQVSGVVTYFGALAVHLWPLALVTEIRLAENTKNRICSPPATLGDRPLVGRAFEGT